MSKITLDDGQGNCPSPGLQFLGNQKSAKGSLEDTILITWPALLTKHLNLLESHVSLLDQLLHNIPKHSSCIKSNDPAKCEVLGKDRRKTIARMLNSAKDVLEQTREAAKEILLQLQRNEKINQELKGTKGTKSERFESKLHTRTQSSKHDATRQGETGQGLKNNLNSDLKYSLSHNTVTRSMEPKSVPESQDQTATDAGFDSLCGNDKNLLTTTTNKSEENVTFSIPNIKADCSTNGFALNQKPSTGLGLTEPNDSASSTTSKIYPELKQKIKHQKNRRNSEPEMKAMKKENITRSTSEDDLPDVDFAALEATLLAEIAAGEKTPKLPGIRAPKFIKEKTDKKRRRRSSDKIEVEKKRIKKILIEEKGVLNKKRKAYDSLVNMETRPNSKKQRHGKERV